MTENSPAQQFELIIAWNIARIQCAGYILQAHFEQGADQVDCWWLEVRHWQEEGPPYATVNRIVVDEVDYSFTRFYLVYAGQNSFEVRLDAEGVTASVHIAGSSKDYSPKLMICDDEEVRTHASVPIALTEEASITSVCGDISRAEAGAVLNVGEAESRELCEPMSRRFVLAAARIETVSNHR